MKIKYLTPLYYYRSVYPGDVINMIGNIELHTMHFIPFLWTHSALISYDNKDVWVHGGNKLEQKLLDMGFSYDS